MVALQPNLEQLCVRPGVGVQSGEAVDLGTEHLGRRRRRDDFELGSVMAFASDKSCGSGGPIPSSPAGSSPRRRSTSDLLSSTFSSSSRGIASPFDCKFIYVDLPVFGVVTKLDVIDQSPLSPATSHATCSW